MTNKEQQNIVRNYNRRVKYAAESGTPKKYLPQTYKLKELRRVFKSKADLNRELKHLQAFTKQSLSEKANVNFNATKWEIKYLTSLRDLAIESFEKRRVTQENRIRRGYVGERDRLYNLEDKINLLQLDLTKVNQRQFLEYKAAINEFLEYPSLQARGYRGFLSEVDWVMENLQIPDKERTRFFNKLKTLTPEQFTYLYKEVDLVERIYDLADSPEFGEVKLNISPEKAKQLINSFMQDIDVYIEEAKANA